MSAGQAVHRRGPLDASSVERDPIAQLRLWLDEAEREPPIEPTAMTLATSTPDGKPSARVVLLRGLDERGLAFFTSYESRKGAELDVNPRAAAVFYWGPLERQVRIEGRVERLDPQESDAYFKNRPRGHRLSAWASKQSAVIPSRAYLEERMRSFDARFAGRDVERPPYWGGYRVVPDRFEFWQGVSDRMHDRIVYRREGESWHIERLSP